MSDFRDDLHWSTAAGAEKFWMRVYSKAFSNIDEVRPGYLAEEQKAGIDRVVVLTNGNTIRIDEKKRRKDYGDILLETVSNVERETPGWMEKDLAIDFLAYAVMPCYRVYFFPWQMLRRAWGHYHEDWKKRYPVKFGTTKVSAKIAYQTANLAVPLPVLQKALALAAIIDAPPDLPADDRPSLGLEKQLGLPFADFAAALS